MIRGVIFAPGFWQLATGSRSVRHIEKARNQKPDARCKRRFDNKAGRLYELRHNRNLKQSLCKEYVWMPIIILKKKF
jgi:hypothetical protein